MNKMISFLLLTVCFGCKVNKEKSERLHEDSQSQSSLETSASWMQFNSQDSSLRYWHFSGDSGFYFHPDLGLWSHSGQIVYGEQRTEQRQATGVVQHYGSLVAETNHAQRLTHSKKCSYPLLSWLWLLLIIPIGGLIYRLRK